MIDAPERIWVWENHDGLSASRGWNLQTSFDAKEYIRADLMAELVDALETARDYVHDASRGALRYRSKADISNMAGEDLVMIDAALAKIKEPQT